jgi:ketosteroid isomerase-like protein
MLAPKLAVKPGREAIQRHIQGLIDAGLTNLTIETQQIERRGNDGAWAAGTYTVTVKDKTIEGNWFRMLKREDDVWKIAMEGFARTGTIDAPAASASGK